MGMMVVMSAARPAVPESESGPDPADTTNTARKQPAQAWSAQFNALGDFIRAQRRLANLSLREMASMTSVSNAYLSQVERGLHQPSLKVLRSIADALELSTEQLLIQAGWTSAGRDGARPAHDATGAGDTEEAIRKDPRLTPEQRTALLRVYRSFVERE
jgi:transcriptional regulator with XRE-family HTH domain